MVTADPALRIMIVEDEALVALEMEACLSDAGHEVAGVAEDLPGAVPLADREKPDLALVDVRLARGSSGLEVARALRDRAVPVLFVTGNCVAEAGKTLALGCLHKPFSGEQLLRAIRTVRSLLAGERPIVRGGHLHLFG